MLILSVRIVCQSGPAVTNTTPPCGSDHTHLFSPVLGPGGWASELRAWAGLVPPEASLFLACRCACCENHASVCLTYFQFSASLLTLLITKRVCGERGASSSPSKSLTPARGSTINSALTLSTWSQHQLQGSGPQTTSLQMPVASPGLTHALTRQLQIRGSHGPLFGFH